MIQVRRGDILLAKLEAGDHRQHGLRPVLVVQNNTGNVFSPTTIVVALTSKPKTRQSTHFVLPKGVGGLRETSTVLCEQIFTLDKRAIKYHIGTIRDKYYLEKLEECLKESILKF